MESIYKLEELEEIIFVSQWLLKDAKVRAVGNSIIKALDELGVEHDILNDTITNNYWCRNYMPVHLGDNTYCGYIYRPDYLWEDEKNRVFITDQKVASKKVPTYVTNQLNLIFDGGNYVYCGNKVILTDKVFMENPQWDQIDIMQILESDLESDIIIIPWDMDDPYGHADRMVAYLGDNRILLNNFRQTEKKRNHPMTTRLIKILERNFDITELSYDCKLEHNSWCYLNYLETTKGIIMPALSPDMDCDNDIAAREQLSKILQKPIKQVYAKPLVTKGGAIHSVTWGDYE